MKQFAPPAKLLVEGALMPARRYMPGSGMEPDRVLLDAAKATLSDLENLPEQDCWVELHAYRYGWTLFAAGYFWEAHEVWEAIWLRTQPASRERLFLQALIQLANAELKLCMGKVQASNRIARKAQSRLEEALTGLPGDLTEFLGVEPTVVAARLRELSQS